MSEAHDLVVPPGPGVPNGLVVPASALGERFVKASGPGGQGVNTTDSRVQLSLDLATCPGLTPRQRERALAQLAGRTDGTVLTVDASESRQQRRNRTLARERLAGILRDALAPPSPARRATRPTKGSVRRRLEAKQRRSVTKELRRRPDA